MKIKLLFLSLLLMNLTNNSFSQEVKTFTKAIEDNSYFIEEAYNQENRVVQHIFNFSTNTETPKYSNFSFTQEWPFLSQKHQLSYTIPYSSYFDGTIKGVGDVMLNYRYQLTGHDDFITLAPRLSAILPTGDKDKALGNGVVGWQLNLPMSKRLTNQFVAHANLGATFYRKVKIGTTEMNSFSYNVGGSVIWLIHSNFNFMFEYLRTFTKTDITNVSPVFTEKSTVQVINPGVRMAINLGNLQIVPGLSVPIYFNDGKSNTNLFFYLSLEHPF